MGHETEAEEPRQRADAGVGGTTALLIPGFDPAKTTLWPKTLSSGPESGLCNQLFALIGYVVIAHDLNQNFILPNFTSHDNGGFEIPFERLFDSEIFAASLASVNVSVLPVGAERLLPNSTRFQRPARLSGWSTYKLISHNRIRWGLGQATKVQLQVEDAVYRGLHPSTWMAQHVVAAQASLGLVPGQYGCMHTRIERDMARQWPGVRAGRPAPLEVYLDGVSTVPGLRVTPKIFVAVGLDIRTEDRMKLDAGFTSSGATLVRMPNEQKSVTRPRLRQQVNTTAVSYTESALVDLFIARQARWFVGWSGSTFARVVGRLQVLDKEHGWWAACPEGIHHIEPNSSWYWNEWALCQPTGVERNFTYAHCSVGRCDPCCAPNGNLYPTKTGKWDGSHVSFKEFEPVGSLWHWSHG